jgi:hypothetical protein
MPPYTLVNKQPFGGMPHLEGVKQYKNTFWGMPHIDGVKYLQSKETLLKFNMKCWSWAFNAQGSRVIILVVQVGMEKI